MYEAPPLFDPLLVHARPVGFYLSSRSDLASVSLLRRSRAYGLVPAGRLVLTLQGCVTSPDSSITRFVAELVSSVRDGLLPFTQHDPGSSAMQGGRITGLHVRRELAAGTLVDLVFPQGIWLRVILTGSRDRQYCDEAMKDI